MAVIHADNAPGELRKRNITGTFDMVLEDKTMYFLRRFVTKDRACFLKNEVVM